MANEKTTKHTCNDGRGPVFGRRTPDCPRCDELANGAPPVTWTWRSRRDDDARRAEEIRNHSCRASRCGRVCTFGDW